LSNPRFSAEYLRILQLLTQECRKSGKLIFVNSEIPAEEEARILSNRYFSRDDQCQDFSRFIHQQAQRPRSIKYKINVINIVYQPKGPKCNQIRRSLPLMSVNCRERNRLNFQLAVVRENSIGLFVKNTGAATCMPLGKSKHHLGTPDVIPAPAFREE
jgi:hypothetical protein